eukprot:1159820-Pelagomonas_calceolata.AAC.2
MNEVIQARQYNISMPVGQYKKRCASGHNRRELIEKERTEPTRQKQALGQYNKRACDSLQQRRSHGPAPQGAHVPISHAT